MDDTVKSIARPAATRSLHDAVRKARVEEAYQLDETADRRDSEIARLELLKAELEAVFAEVPPNDDRFTLMLVPSRPARLWIDLFTYGAIDETSGAYLFIRNSETGRSPLAGSRLNTTAPTTSAAATAVRADSSPSPTAHARSSATTVASRKLTDGSKMSPTRNVTLSETPAARAVAVASAISAGSMSMPTPRAPKVFAASMTMRPSPQPRS